MRLLIWHVDHFASHPGQRGRSPIRDDPPWSVEISEGLLVYAAAEPADAADVAAAGERTAAAILKVARQLKATTVVLHSFAHLFGELAPPDSARAVLAAARERLLAADLSCYETPFGWFNTLDIQAKGHPISRIARIV